MKDTLKVAQQLCRLSKRVATDPGAFKKAWSSETWHGLAKKLSEASHYKSSTSLSKTCITIAKLAETGTEEQKKTVAADENKVLTKRKNGVEGDSKQEKKRKKAKAS